jgi:hypothetical protein
MKHDDRRRELGKMLMDTAKYLATVGLISGFLAGGISFLTGLIVMVSVLILTTVGFYTVPPKKEE